MIVLKILLLSNMYPSEEHPFYGTFVESFKKGGQDNDVDFDLSVIRGKSSSRYRKFFSYFLYIIRSLYKIYFSTYDIIYVHYINHSLLPLFFHVFVKKKPLILNAHGSDVLVSGRLSKILSRLLTHVVNRADLIVVPSEYFKDIVIQKFNFSPAQVFVSPSGGVDLNRFSRKNNSHNNSHSVFGYVSRIDRDKGWDVFLRSLSSLRRKNYQFQAIIVGGGAQVDELTQLIYQEGLQDLVDYRGAMAHGDLPEVYKFFDFFVFPSQREAESLGLVGLEAMASGVPVIASEIGGIKSYLRDFENGLYAKPGSVSDLSEKIELAIHMSEGEYSRFQDECIATAEEFDSNKVYFLLFKKLNEFVDVGR